MKKFIKSKINDAELSKSKAKVPDIVRTEDEPPLPNSSLSGLYPDSPSSSKTELMNNNGTKQHIKYEKRQSSQVYSDEHELPIEIIEAKKVKQENNTNNPDNVYHKLNSTNYVSPMSEFQSNGHSSGYSKYYENLSPPRQQVQNATYNCQNYNLNEFLNYNQNFRHYNQNSSNYNQNFSNYNQNSSNYNQNSSNDNQNFSHYNQNSSNYNQNVSNCNQLNVYPHNSSGFTDGWQTHTSYNESYSNFYYNGLPFQGIPNRFFPLPPPPPLPEQTVTVPQCSNQNIEAVASLPHRTDSAMASTSFSSQETNDLTNILNRLFNANNRNNRLHDLLFDSQNQSQPRNSMANNCKCHLSVLRLEYASDKLKKAKLSKEELDQKMALLDTRMQKLNDAITVFGTLRTSNSQDEINSMNWQQHHEFPPQAVNFLDKFSPKDDKSV